MKYRLMDLLACPACKKFPLKLDIYETRRFPEREFKISRCELYCAYENRFLEGGEEESTSCDECIKVEIVGGLLTCENCNIWYPIYEEIPVMLLGELRDRKLEQEFVKKYRNKLPGNVVKDVLGVR